MATISRKNDRKDNKMIELKDFIEQSVSDITDAIKNLKQKYNASPQIQRLKNFEYNPIAPNNDDLNDKLQQKTIDFDIAVTTVRSASAKAGGKVGIKVIGGSLNGECCGTKENSSRLKFSIPFYPGYIKKD